MKIKNNEDFYQAIEGLINAWCDRRNLKALRFILNSWPFVSGLTDEWEALSESLKSIRSFCKKEITEDELDIVNTLSAEVDKLLSKRG